MIPLTKEDMLDVQTIGRVGKNLFPFNHLWFALKDKIVEKYGLFRGFVLQSWEDDPDEWRDFEGATHHHILKEYWLCAGNIDEGDEFIILHSPTNEYKYFSWNTPYEKKSEGYDDLLLEVKHEIKGKKNYTYNSWERGQAWKLLKRLVRKYGFLLRECS